MAKRKRIDLNASPGDSPLYWLDKKQNDATPITKPPVDESVDAATVFEWIEEMNGHGVEIRVRWGTLGAFDPHHHGMRVAQATALPGSPLYKHGLKYVKTTDEHTTVIGALAALMKLMPQIEAADYERVDGTKPDTVIGSSQ